jgi:hypothetical protein
VVLLHAALKFRVVAEAARLVLGDVGGVRLKRVCVLETREEYLALAVGHDTASFQDGFTVRRSFRAVTLDRCRPQMPLAGEGSLPWRRVWTSLCASGDIANEGLACQSTSGDYGFSDERR